jgi:hypothetical protein
VRGRSRAPFRVTLLRWAALSGNRVLELSAIPRGVRLSVVVLDGPTRRQCGGFDLTLTGVAGLGGGTPEKPVGTVWIAVADAAGSVARRTIFPGSRQEIRSRAAQAALFLLNRRLAG